MHINRPMNHLPNPGENLGKRPIYDEGDAIGAVRDCDCDDRDNKAKEKVLLEREGKKER